MRQSSLWLTRLVYGGGRIESPVYGMRQSSSWLTRFIYGGGRLESLMYEAEQSMVNWACIWRRKTWGPGVWGRAVSGLCMEEKDLRAWCKRQSSPWLTRHVNGDLRARCMRQSSSCLIRLVYGEGRLESRVYEAEQSMVNKACIWRRKNWEPGDTNGFVN